MKHDATSLKLLMMKTGWLLSVPPSLSIHEAPSAKADLLNAWNKKSDKQKRVHTESVRYAQPFKQIRLHEIPLSHKLLLLLFFLWFILSTHRSLFSFLGIIGISQSRFSFAGPDSTRLVPNSMCGFWIWSEILVGIKFCVCSDIRYEKCHWAFCSNRTRTIPTSSSLRLIPLVDMVGSV